MVNDVFNLLQKYASGPAPAISGVESNFNKGVEVKKEQVTKIEKPTAVSSDKKPGLAKPKITAPTVASQATKVEVHRKKRTGMASDSDSSSSSDDSNQDSSKK